MCGRLGILPHPKPPYLRCAACPREPACTGPAISFSAKHSEYINKYLKGTTKARPLPSAEASYRDPGAPIVMATLPPDEQCLSVATGATAQIRNAARRYLELCNTLSQLSHAHLILRQQNEYICDLDVQAAAAQAKTRLLDQRREQGFREHEMYRKSIVRRFACRIRGRKDIFEARAAQGQREYLDVLHEAHRAQEQENRLKELRETACRRRHALLRDVIRHRQAEADLDELYHQIFEGPTPEFPEEDEKERQMRVACQAYDDIQARAEAARHVVQALSSAVSRIQLALARIEEARSYNTVLGRDTEGDLGERIALHQADIQIKEAQKSAMDAQHNSPFAGEKPSGSIDDQLEAALRRCEKLDTEVADKKQAVEAARNELRTTRDSIFNQVVEREHP